MSGREFRLTKPRVEAAMEDVQPETIVSLYVVVNGRRYPPRQVLAKATGLAPKGIRSDIAERWLRQLGFVTGKVSGGTTGYADHHARIRGRKNAAARRYNPSVLPDGEVKGRYHKRAPKPESAEAAPAPSAHDTFEAQLRQHVGQWVATRGTDLLFAAPDAKSVIAWLIEHDERAESMYKVPEDLSQISGTASA